MFIPNKMCGKCGFNGDGHFDGCPHADEQIASARKASWAAELHKAKDSFNMMVAEKLKKLRNAAS